MPLIPALTYIDVYDADDYFSTRLDSEVWDNAAPERKLAALVTATRAIDLLQFVDAKADPAQPLQFPRVRYRGGPAYATPAAVLAACCEEALARLDGLDIELEVDGTGVSTTTYAGVRETYDRTVVYEGVRAGIGSNQAWNLLVPWLADGLTLALTRA